ISTPNHRRTSLISLYFLLMSFTFLAAILDPPYWNELLFFKCKGKVVTHHFKLFFSVEHDAAIDF
ncbi:hypothetical protein, partial [Pseudomonas poae]|uniref:hypothetical protein n=1 Tax=Pseudomonas poae TaxID=200451 RepID=UPI0034D5A53F